MGWIARWQSESEQEIARKRGRKLTNCERFVDEGSGFVLRPVSRDGVVGSR